MIHALRLMTRFIPAIAGLFLAGLLQAATGPTLHFDYATGGQSTNPLVKFMYFVPLVSPEPVCVLTNAGNTQSARVTSFSCRTNGVTFRATCEFEMDGSGVQRNLIDHSEMIRRHDKDLKSGKLLEHQLASINVEGAGCGTVEVEGLLTNGQTVVTEVRLQFNRGQSSPVSVSLQDIGCTNGVIHPQNEIVARVNTLTFHERSGKPEMEVTLASVKSKGAGNGFWQNFVGGLKGMAANLFIPPLRITRDGHRAMMDFGLALAMGKPVFTFPVATRLEGAGTLVP